jgi:hypothetical protein
VTSIMNLILTAIFFENLYEIASLLALLAMTLRKLI